MTTPAHVLVRVRLADRPGALGQVASRIGSLRGDIVRIDVLEHDAGEAVDDFAVVLPDISVVAVLIKEIAEVDGASVESVREVDHMPNARMETLKAVTRLVTAETRTELSTRVCEYARLELHADWATLTFEGELLASDGENGSATTATTESQLENSGSVLSVGNDTELHATDRTQLAAIAELTDALFTRMDRSG